MKTKAFIAAASAFILASGANAALVKADFSGAVQFPNIANPFLGMSSGGGAASHVFGSIVYDDAAPIGSGYYNLLVPVAATDAFAISIGSQLSFDYDDLQAGGVAAVQYHNGVYRGIVFTADFASGNKNYTFSSQGGTWSIYDSNTFQTFASGYYNGGAQGLTNIRPYGGDAAVPEPAAWALMISGFALAGIATRRRARTSVTYA